MHINDHSYIYIYIIKSCVCVSRKIGNTCKIVMLMENMLANHGILMDFDGF